MTDVTLADAPTSIRRLTSRAWRDVLSIYYANTPAWRWLKSGGLLLFGLAVWSGANVLHSYVHWELLTYLSAYGLLLVVWGPLTHLLVVPGVIRLRRSGDGGLSRLAARHGSTCNLAVFISLVIVFGTFTPGIVMLEFSGVGTSGAGDASADLVCDVGEETIACSLEEPRGFDHAVVRSGGRELERVEGPPYTFEVRREELSETRTGRQFEVELRDAEGETLRRYVRVV